MEEPADENDDPTPPAAERVTRRALVLTAMACRGVIERESRHGTSSPADTAAMHARLTAWFDQLGVDAELEPDERQTLETPAGELPDQDAVNALWRVEGLAVLAWALGRFDLPGYDALVDVDAVFAAMRLRDPAASDLLNTAELRPADELGRYQRQVLGYHWRMRDFGLRPVRMDFRAFAGNCWFGSFDLTGFKLIDNELALDGERLDRCHRETVSRCASIVTERHKAANWLLWGGEAYSDVDTST